MQHVDINFVMVLASIWLIHWFTACLILHNCRAIRWNCD